MRIYPSGAHRRSFYAVALVEYFQAMKFASGARKINLWYRVKQEKPPLILIHNGT